MTDYTRNLEHEVDLTKGQLEEESASKNDALRLLSKSVGDSQMWRQKYEKEGLAKAEESESAKLKLQSRYSADDNMECHTSCFPGSLRPRAV